ncbi:MAG: ABC transporter permease subunit [Anaerolineales bacterium]|jgi:peptide/nickel transport system permease protein
MTTVPETPQATSEGKPSAINDGRHAARLGPARWFGEQVRVYGAEWWLTVAGGLLLISLILLMLLAPLLTPYAPDRTAGAGFIPPFGGRESLIYPIEAPLLEKAELVGKTVGVISNSSSHTQLNWQRTEIALVIFREESEMLDALQAGELDAVGLETKAAQELLPSYPNLAAAPDPLVRRFFLGTDNLGRDLWSRLVFGGRSVVLIALLAALVSLGVGVPIGLLSGFFGGRFDQLLSLVMDSIYSFPGLILAIALAAMLGPGVLNIAVAISVVYIPTYFRIVRGQVLAIKETLYVEAAKSLGASPREILAQYVFPNVIPSIVVVFSLNIADSILTEAGLSFLGLGLPPPTPDWGYDLSKGKDFLAAGIWWPITFPGFMITLVALGFALLGEGLGEILNPRLVET